MSDNGGGEEERIARGTGVKEQISRGAAVRELNSATEPGRRPGGDPDRRMPAPEQSRVPSWLATGSAWAWRLLLLAVVIYLIARLLGILYIVVVPCIAALLLTAVLQPLTSRLRRAGLPALAATWVTLLVAAVVLGGLVTLVANRVSADYPTLLAETKHTTAQIQTWLAGPPFHLKNNNVQKFLNNIPSYLSKHKSLVEGTVVTGGKIASEFFGGLVLMIFVMFFLIKDGDRIWNWLLGAMRTDTARRMDRAGHASWLVLVYYMRGTVAVAAIHAVVVGVALWIMGVPLAVPLAVLVFLAAFVPLVGLLVAGALAVIVTLATKGWVDAVILLGILIVEDQLEAHLLQPQVVGKMIRLHPLAVILSLAVGGILAGIPGAVVAVPIVAVITRALPELRRSEPEDLGPDDA
ncbi:MAG TPA: AI-2E family transporter [Streptosporangiaceae bacterium]|nr:AI-2E family transporter [Streptosporangiaceae bacterium]